MNITLGNDFPSWPEELSYSPLTNPETPGENLNREIFTESTIDLDRFKSSNMNSYHLVPPQDVSTEPENGEGFIDDDDLQGGTNCIMST